MYRYIYLNKLTVNLFSSKICYFCLFTGETCPGACADAETNDSQHKAGPVVSVHILGTRLGRGAAATPSSSVHSYLFYLISSFISLVFV